MIYIGETEQKTTDRSVQGGYVTLLGEPFYRIENFDAMDPFFMSIVSASDHWLFIASTGGLSAGRVNSEQALFPYYTHDKLTENSENTGSKTILLVNRQGRTSLWEPFSERSAGGYRLVRSLYKNVSGTAVLFEEANQDLGLTFRYAWRTGDRYGFVRTAWLINTGGATSKVEVLDGLQNLLPANVSSATQNIFSALLDAYKRAELDAATGLGVFALSSSLTDLAEPSESLLAATVGQVGLPADAYLLSAAQFNRFRQGKGVTAETDVRGQRCAYGAHAVLDLAPGQSQAWHIFADVSQDSARVAERIEELKRGPAEFVRALEADLAANQAAVDAIVASSDGWQLSGDPLAAAHHYANVLFNVMRGGVFADGYSFAAADFKDYVALHNRPLLVGQAAFFAGLPARLTAADLTARARAAGSPDLLRLAAGFLPLTFSRRHGDPSRPWNRFSINLKKPDGSRRLDYEGNWRDIFQNWEALAYSYPEFSEAMLAAFLNATTADGYNPGRLVYGGPDWETPEPGNPWANLGYWSDHQIIYLQKLMEVSARLHPGRLGDWLDKPMFSHANVPYRIKPYADLLADPYSTIQFDWDLEKQIEAGLREVGTDAKLLRRPDGQVLQVSLTEKLLTLLLAKLANFVPEGGVWMNTQRPEWNDANNALVGKGLSVVTLCYLRRYTAFCRDLLAAAPGALAVSAEVRDFYAEVAAVLRQFQPALKGAFDDGQRRAMLDALGEAGGRYRARYYRQGFSGEQVSVPASDLAAFFELAQAHIEHSLRANRRADGLYHSYNILKLGEGRAAVGHLYEMLEGQVAVLSSGMLSSEESLSLLQTLRNGSMFRADQHTYILYPDRDLPGFLKKNCLAESQVKDVGLIAALVAAGDTSLITRDLHGVYHFSGRLRNARDASKALTALKADPRFSAGVAADSGKVLALFEETFHHDEFTGRSGTFFAYEGLGSIYWHMVSKLLLAVQEAALNAGEGPSAPALRAFYADVRAGLGFHKPPDVYGAFPTDPYSHTPKGQGAKQPGMTGMVKEEVLTRQAEVGWGVQAGRLVFDARLLDRGELLAEPAGFTYLGVDGQTGTLDLPAGSLGYTICQTPVILQGGEQAGIVVVLADGTTRQILGGTLDAETSAHIFQRDGRVRRLVVTFQNTVPAGVSAAGRANQ